MLIIYACYGGAHTSPMAAAIHLGRLKGDPLPSLEDILNVQYFDVLATGDRGRVFPVGTDELGNQVYILGRGNYQQPIIQAVKSGYMLAGGDPRQIMFVNTLKGVNWPMRVGGFLSRRLGLISLGRMVAAIGARWAYPKLMEIVAETKAKCAAGGHRHSPSFSFRQE
ncbi:MAG: DUF3189 family protein [Firmicutes bacterium]|jgi:hypothetical protein|nr:DUF3189 family protein [Bacillota bacterium]